jgi:chemotaxis protein methyltransferase CheR
MTKVFTQELDEATFIALRDRIVSFSGIYLDESRRRSLGQIIYSRMSRQGLNSWDEYLSLLDSSSGPEEMSTLTEEVVNNETTFFRNPRHFRVLAETVLPELDRSRPSDMPIRLWSAGCSTGQEPYSIAITVAELFGLPPRRPVEIIGTDISERALEFARQGRYAERQLKRVERPYQKRYFQREGSYYRIRPELGELVHFQPLNLIKSFPPQFHGMDVVFCRNVTIYFQVETCKNLMAKLYRYLSEGGYLFIGFSETLWQIFDAFERIQAGGTFFYRKGSASQLWRPRLAQDLPRPKSVPGGGSVERPLYLGETQRKTVPAPATEAKPTILRTVPEQDPARVHYHKGMESLRDGDYEEALAAFRAALRAEPNLVEGYCGIAQVYANQGRYQQALLACERALEVDDLAEEAYLLRGLVYRQMDKLEKAIADLERASYLNPSSPTAHFYLGDALLALKQQTRALRAFQRTWRTLLGQSEDAIIDGVPVYLLRQACQNHIRSLTSSSRSVAAT